MSVLATAAMPLRQLRGAPPASSNCAQQENVFAPLTKEVACDDATVPTSVLATIEPLNRETEEYNVALVNWFEISNAIPVMMQ